MTRRTLLLSLPGLAAIKHILPHDGLEPPPLSFDDFNTVLKANQAHVRAVLEQMLANDAAILRLVKTTNRLTTTSKHLYRIPIMAKIAP